MDGGHAGQLFGRGYAVNKERMLRLSEYSRDCLRELRAATGIHYEERTRGTLQLFRTEAQLEAARRDIAVLEEVGVPYELLDRNRLATAEPALERSSHKLSGGLRLPNDETGDCHLFTTAWRPWPPSWAWSSAMARTWPA